jgi:predicted kinase
MIVVITGPIASGKSTVANELARQLSRNGVRAEVIDLDLVYDGLVAEGFPPEPSTWMRARGDAATTAAAFLEDGTAVVVAEGSYNLPDDRSAFVDRLRSSPDVVFVTLRVSFEEALRRARGDPTRGRSRDPEFLGAHYAERHELLAAVPETDLVFDTERVSPATAAASIARLIGRPSA